NLLQSIKWVAMVLGGLLFVLAAYLFVPPVSFFSAVFASLFSGVFLLISYIGFRAEAKVESTIEVGLKVAGEQVNKITDAVAERIKN
ncbi:hypothetical protein KA005_42525, partial [bacterium]|nr:hypothetical protein [bacterium]